MDYFLIQIKLSIYCMSRRKTYLNTGCTAELCRCCFNNDTELVTHCAVEQWNGTRCKIIPKHANVSAGGGGGVLVTAYVWYSSSTLSNSCTTCSSISWQFSHFLLDYLHFRTFFDALRESFVQTQHCWRCFAVTFTSRPLTEYSCFEGGGSPKLYHVGL